MIGPIKEFLHAMLPYVLYGMLWFTILWSIFRRAEWALYALVLLTPLPNVWYQLQTFPLGNSTIDLLAFACLLGILINKGGFQVPPRLGTVMMFIFVSYVALWNSASRFDLPIPLTLNNPDLSDWKNYGEMIFLYVLTYNVVRTEQEQRRLITFIAVIILLITVRETRNFSAGAAFSYDSRSAGPFWRVGLGANHFAAFLADYGTLLFGIGLLLKDKADKWRRWLFLGSAASCVYPLFFAYSRGAYAGTLAALTTFGIVKVRKVLVALAVLAFVWQAVLPTTVVERITMTKTADGQIEDSAAQRLQMWEHAAGLFSANPVFGVGFGGFRYTHPPLGLTDTHNFYMKVASEQGMIGLFVFAVIVLTAGYSGWRLFRKADSDLQRGLGFGFMGCVVSMIITNIFGDRWSYFILGSYFWISWGLVDRGYTVTVLAKREALAARVGPASAVATATPTVPSPTAAAVQHKNAHLQRRKTS